MNLLPVYHDSFHFMLFAYSTGCNFFDQALSSQVSPIVPKFLNHFLYEGVRSILECVYPFFHEV